ncbi:MAG TPA: amino acid ABC transporter permease [Candidatus Limnocylindrales bacterium]|nr:amino acid ABC transporter permease [Candidatus Limnocylindrales bacterium]
MSFTGGPVDAGGLIDLGGSSAPSPRRERRRIPPGEALRSLAVGAASTVVVFGILGWIVVNSPGWAAVQASFFDPTWFAYSLPEVVDAFTVNVQLFAIAEVLILVLGLVVAVLRGIPGPAFFPVRLIATVYADLFRAVPGVLIIYLLGFGIPTLDLPGMPTEPFVYAVAALALVYSAYVSEVYRAGIESVHPSQEAAARSLGLTRFQAMRYVVLPQAVRRVIPPLLNDFIGLQKDTVLVSYIGVVEIFRQAQIIQAAKFNFTPYLAVALVFVVITIPLARLTDWLVARDRRRAAAVAR